MKVQCPRCRHEIELEMDIRIKSAECDFCKLSPMQRDLIKNLILCDLNVSEFMDATGESRSIIKKQIREIIATLFPGCEQNKNFAARTTLSNGLIKKCIDDLHQSTFSTNPDFIQFLEENYPLIIEKYMEESPRNWRSRIGRKLSSFARITGYISIAGRTRNSYLWKVN